MTSENETVRTELTQSFRMHGRHGLGQEGVRVRAGFEENIEE